MAPAPLQRILLVEDDPDILAITKLALEAVGGFTVVGCATGPVALAAAPAFAPDLILLDSMLPEMDGLAILAALRALGECATTPVIFLTARVRASEIASYRAHGALDIIPKPF